jgi:hypothetical protein
VHTSNLVFFLFLAATALAVVAQIMNYLCIDSGQRTGRRKIALAAGIAAVVMGAASGYMAAVDWAALPKSPEGLRPGQLFDNGGVPEIVK